MKILTKEQFEESLLGRSPEYVSLIREVLDDPSYWTVDRFIRRYGLLPRRKPGVTGDKGKIDRTPSHAKHVWHTMEIAGLLNG